MPVYVSNETDQFSWFRLHIITDVFLALANIPSLCLILAGHTTHIRSQSMTKCYACRQSHSVNFTVWF